MQTFLNHIGIKGTSSILLKDIIALEKPILLFSKSKRV